MSKSPPSLRDLYVKPGAPLPDAQLPRVAIVVLNFNGRHHLELCFDSLFAMDYPRERFEVILIDNASDDGSVEFVRQRWPQIRLHVNDRNVGFAPGCNQGASLRGEADMLAFVNNDMRVDPRWLRELVAPIVRGECVATTSKMMSWDGKTLDSAGGGMNFHGLGLQYGHKHPPGVDFDQPRKTLFACGGAMAMDAALYDSIGGFDNEFFAYYEDVDLGWRTWVLGHEVHYAPLSVCWHHHHGTSKRLPLETVRLIQVRNPLLACFKNYDDDNLRKVLPVALALATRRALIVSGVPSDQPYRIENARPAEPGAGPGLLERLAVRLGLRKPVRHGMASVTRVSVADLIAANDLLSNWDHWMRRRADVQSRRRRPDEEIFQLFLRPMWCVETDPQYRQLFDGSTRFFGLGEMFDGLTLIDEDPRH